MRQAGAVSYVGGCPPEGRQRHSSRHTLAVVIAIVLLAAVPNAGQVAPAEATTAETTTGIPPSTPWGDPDLQGIWNNSTITPLERPSEFAGQRFLTEEEAAALEQRTAASRIDRLPRSGDTGTYNQFWFDRGTTVVPTRCTSLIVDPPSGRFPPLTPDAHRRVTSPEAQRLADARRGRRPADSCEDLDLSDRCIWYRGMSMTKNPDLMDEHACHEGNYEMTGILAGSRAAERAAAEPATTSSR